MRCVEGRHLLGRDRELAAVEAAVNGGVHVLVEGPSGVGKSFLARVACERAGVVPERVDGGLTSTIGHLMGQHDAALALRSGFGRDTFTPGPLLRAVVAGRPLILDDADAVAPGVLGALVGVMSERTLVVPRVGGFTAAPGFVVLATAGTAAARALPGGFTERMLHVGLDHLPPDVERRVVDARAPFADPWLRARAVGLVRATRTHPDIARGASLRAAIDLLAIARCLRVAAAASAEGRSGPEPSREEIGLRAAWLALSSRIALHPWVTRDVEAVIADLWADVEITASRARGSPPPGLAAPPPVLQAAGGDEAAEEGAHRDLDPSANGPTTGVTAESGGVRSGAARGMGTVTPGPRHLSADDVERESAVAVADLAYRSGRGSRPVADRAGDDGAVDLELVQRLAAGVVVRRARERTIPVAAVGGRLATVRYAFRSDDLDIDRTIDALVEHPLPDLGDLWVHDRVPHQRSVVVMLDVSGSMRGARLIEVATAAVAAALALERDDLAVVAFGETTRVLHPGGSPLAPQDLASRVLALRPRGLTDLAAGLRAGRALAAAARGRRSLAVVMTDGVANTGDDPLAVARGFDQLNVLATTSSRWRLQQCRALAAAGSGVCEAYVGVDALAPVMTRLLAG